MNTTEIIKHLDGFFEANRAEMIADTAALVKISSVRTEAKDGMPFGEGCAAALSEAEKILKKHGFAAENHDNYFLTADAYSEEALGEPALGILAHLDVVEAGGGWTFPPYALTLQDGMMYGRGTADDKGPAIAAIYALKAAMQISDLAKNVRIILGSAEETGSEDMRYYRKVCKMPPMVFSPDADFPLINIEKGRYAPVYSADLSEEYAALSKNTAANGNIFLKSIRGGETTNIVPQTACCTVSGISAEELADRAKTFFHSDACFSEITADAAKTPDGFVVLTVHGKGAHAAFPSGGANAQSALVDFLCTLPLMNTLLKEQLCKLQTILPYGETDGASLGIKMEDAQSGALTAAFTTMSYEDGILRCGLDIRSPIMGNEENVVTPANNTFAKQGFTARERRMTPPHYTDENSMFVKTLLSAYETVTGEPGSCMAIGGGTYVHDIEGGVAFGCAMPGTDYRLHGADEFMPVDELITSAKIFALAILKLCGEQG